MRGTDNWDRRSQPKETKPSFLSLRTTHSNGTNFLLPQSFSSLPSSHSLSSSARTHYTKPCQSCDPANNFIQFLGHHAGYYRLPHTVDARESNLIFVEQPTGTGFSYSFSANDTHHNEESISNDLYDFLQATCGSTSTCTDAFNVCIDIKDEVLHLNGNNLNVYDIRKQREGPLFYDFSKVVEFLNQKAVREALGVGDIQFVPCSNTVSAAMIHEGQLDEESGSWDSCSP
ncbi:unnamed protein product [Camellia sinensis]